MVWFVELLQIVNAILELYMFYESREKADFAQEEIWKENEHWTYWEKTRLSSSTALFFCLRLISSFFFLSLFVRCLIFVWQFHTYFILCEYDFFSSRSLVIFGIFFFLAVERYMDSCAKSGIYICVRIWWAGVEVWIAACNNVSMMK